MRVQLDTNRIVVSDSVVLLDGLDDRWVKFATSNPRSTIFHHPAWSRLLAECYGYRPFVCAVCGTNAEIAAGLPVMEIDHLLSGHRWVSLPFSDYCFPLAADSQALQCLARSLEALSRKPGAPKIEIRWEFPGSVIPGRPASIVLHTLQLQPRVEKVKERIHHSHLRNVRIAQAHGVEIRRGITQKDLDAFYRLHLETRHRQGVPVQPKRYFKLLEELILKKGLGFVSLAYQDAECLAAAVFLYWKRTLTYKYGASNAAGMSLRPNHLIFWDAIQWGCNNGFDILDFGRSEVENYGLRAFKSRWGAVETPLNYSCLPLRTPSVDQGRLPMLVVRALIRRSPNWVCRLGGEVYYRYLA